MSSLDPCMSAPLGGFAAGYTALALLNVDAPESAKPAGLVLSIKQAVGANPVELSIAKSNGGGGATSPAKAPKAKPPPAAPKPAAAAPKPAVAAKPVGSEPPKMSVKEVAECSVEQTVSAQQQRLIDLAASIGLASAKFARVRSDYYEQELGWRRDVIGAASVVQLCKSMIMENTKLKDKTVEQCVAEGRIKYVCTVVQYDGPNLNKDRLTDVVQQMEGSKAVGKKQYNLRMVDGAVSAQLSGFEHNAVTPLGMATPLPVLLSARIAGVPDGQLWLGGGEPDLKLRVHAEEFIKVFNSGGAMAGFSARFAEVV